MRFVLLTALALILTISANLALRWRFGRFALATAPYLAALAILLLAYLALPSPYALVFVPAALFLFASGTQRFRIYLSRWLPIDPANPLHAAGLALTLFFVFDHFGSYLINGPAPVPSSASVTFLDQLTNFSLMFGLALFGVGLLTRRTPSATWRRLGFRRVNRFQVFFALGLGSAFQLVGLVAYFLAHFLTPNLAQHVDQSSNALLGGLLATPLGILFLALSAGVGEEMLFRGALQPRLGLLLTALLFTAFHDQYGFSFELLGIFVLAFALGWLRNTMNLWVCIGTHAWFDFLGGLGFNLPVVIGLALIGVATCLLLLHSHSARLFPPEETVPIRWQQV